MIEQSDTPKEDQQEGEFSDDYAPSKSAQKRAMHELQSLGESLLYLKEDEINQLTLSQSLVSAIVTAKKIKAREGKRRQLQFIGKLMRKQEEGTIADIRKLFEEKNRNHQQSVQIDHQAEHWREELLSNGDAAIQKFLESFPNGDRTHIRQLVRACLTEQSQKQPPANQRKLFRYIKTQLVDTSTG